MKNCPKCGLANDVMRKYCRRCGAPLIQAEEETTPEPIEELEEEPIAAMPGASDNEPLESPADRAPVNDEEPLVRPSTVASDQAEMESVEPESYGMTEETPAIDESSPEPIEDEGSGSSTMDYERGKEVVADILDKVRAAEARQRSEMESESTEPDIEPPPVEPEESESFPVFDEPEPEVEIEEPVSVEEPEAKEEPASFTAPASPALQKPSLEDEIARDEKVRFYESDIKAFNLELQQFQSELATLRTHLDEEVARYHTVSEEKRIRVESLERELNLAKKEHKDAYMMLLNGSGK